MQRKIEIGVTNLIQEETKYFLFSLSVDEDIEEGCNKFVYDLWEKNNKNEYSYFFYNYSFNDFTYFINDIG